MKEFGFDKMIWHVNVVVFVICLSLVSPTFAQSGGDYTLTWSTIDGGGGTSIGGSYTLSGTIGQPNAGSASGGIYDLLGGFWPGVSDGITPIIVDFCGANFGPSDGYVDVWDLMQFADHWHSRTGDSNWDPKFDLTGLNFGDPDGYIDVWDLMVFADHWHEGVKP